MKTYLVKQTVLAFAACLAVISGLYSQCAAKEASGAGDDKTKLSAELDVQSTVSFNISLDSSTLYLGKYGAGEKTDEQGVTVSVTNSSGLFFAVMARSNGTYVNSKGDRIPEKNVISRVRKTQSSYCGDFNPDYDGDAGNGAYISEGNVWLYRVLPTKSQADTKMSMQYTEQVDIPEQQPEGHYERTIVFTLTAE